MYLPTNNQPNFNPKITVKIENMIDILSINVSKYNLEKLFPSDILVYFPVVCIGV